MVKRLLLYVLFALAIGAVWINREAVRSYVLQDDGFGAAVEEFGDAAAGKIDTIRKEISAPPPLRSQPGGSKPASLTADGTVRSTNEQRAAEGLPALTVNAQLAAAAQAKLDDMFARQYFEHVSPTGEGPSHLAEEAGYEYVAIGENLAEGNFAGDQDLVQAWMDSPGHRANIMAGKFTEIGVAVGVGTFEGRRTWMAVQEFGKPLSACTQLDPLLKTTIASNEDRIDRMKADADRLKSELDAMGQPRTRQEADDYNAKVDAYNAVAQELNSLISRTKAQIEEFNKQVRAFNECAGA